MDSYKQKVAEQIFYNCLRLEQLNQKIERTTESASQLKTYLHSTSSAERIFY